MLWRLRSCLSISSISSPGEMAGASMKISKRTGGYDEIRYSLKGEIWTSCFQ